VLGLKLSHLHCALIFFSGFQGRFCNAKTAGQWDKGFQTRQQKVLQVSVCYFSNMFSLNWEI